jgi:hypothetical protein
MTAAKAPSRDECCASQRGRLQCWRREASNGRYGPSRTGPGAETAGRVCRHVLSHIVAPRARWPERCGQTWTTFLVPLPRTSGLRVDLRCCGCVGPPLNPAVTLDTGSEEMAMAVEGPARPASTAENQILNGSQYQCVAFGVCTLR